MAARSATSVNTNFLFRTAPSSLGGAVLHLYLVAFPFRKSKNIFTLSNLEKNNNVALQWIEQHVTGLAILPLFFLLHTVRYHFGVVNAYQVFLMYGICLLVMGCIYLISLKLLQSKKVAAASVLMAIVIYFLWGRFHLFIANVVPAAKHSPVKLLLLTLLLLCLSLVVLKRNAHRIAWKKWYLLINIFAVLITMMEIGYLMAIAINSKSATAFTPLPEPPGNTSVKPNIYFLIFDEYASSRSLKEDWHFDNKSHDSLLQNMGFLVQDDGHSNYANTHFSIASMLNADYLPDLPDSSKIDTRDYLHTGKWINEARVPRAFATAGYAIRNHSVFEVNYIPRIGTDKFIPVGLHLLNVGTLFEVLYPLYRAHFKSLLGKSNAQMDPNSFFYQHHLNKKIQDSLVSSVKPSFTYAHIMLPHSPFYYDSAGKMLAEQVSKQQYEKNDTLGYINNVKTANQAMQNMVISIQASDKNALIIIAGDHGYRRDKHTQKTKYGYRSYRAFYFPDGDYSSIPANISGVNIFRVVLNKTLGYQLPMLEHEEIFLHSGL